jgi:hypothetical protein
MAKPPMRDVIASRMGLTDSNKIAHPGAQWRIIEGSKSSSSTKRQFKQRREDACGTCHMVSKARSRPEHKMKHGKAEPVRNKTAK